jgi:hypothetical protein
MYSLYRLDDDDFDMNIKKNIYLILKYIFFLTFVYIIFSPL